VVQSISFSALRQSFVRTASSKASAKRSHSCFVSGALLALTRAGSTAGSDFFWATAGAEATTSRASDVNIRRGTVS
jgi:hypothetical protein